MHLGTSLCILTGKRLDGKKLINLGEVLKGHFFLCAAFFSFSLGTIIHCPRPRRKCKQCFGDKQKMLVYFSKWPCWKERP